MNILLRCTMPLVLISLFGCFQKKPKHENLQTWLDTHFPGQLIIDHNLVNLDPKNLFYKKTSTIVADRQDPVIQIQIDWYRKEEGLDISKDAVQLSLDQAREDIASARTLFQALQNEGLDTFSVGVLRGAAYVLTFQEPTPEMRTRLSGLLLNALHALGSLAPEHIWVECMEPSAYRQEFQDIVPLGYWRRGDSYHDKQKILSAELDYQTDLTPEMILAHWKINPGCDRASTYHQAAIDAAVSWAEKNIREKVYVEGQHQYWAGVDEGNPMAVEYSFPWLKEKPLSDTTDWEDMIQGYIKVTYHPETQQIVHIRNAKNP